MQRSRNWCFTDFELLDWPQLYKRDSMMIRYICVGTEICPKTKRKHQQGWVQFNKPKRMSRVKSLFGTKKLHLEACRGDEFSNDNYCKKDQDFVSFGKFVAQGQRTDLESAIQELRDGGTVHELALNRPQLFVQYRNGLKDLKQEFDKEDTKAWRDVYVEYVWGKTRTGKTRYAVSQRCLNGDRPFVIDACDLRWWDGYDGETTIVIDEYCNDVKINVLLKLLEGYQKRLEIKGGFTWAKWNRVIMTSNFSPDNMHGQAKDQSRDALMARISKVTHLT